jgi:hypothetical protein
MTPAVTGGVVDIESADGVVLRLLGAQMPYLGVLLWFLYGEILTIPAPRDAPALIPQGRMSQDRGLHR